MEKRQKVGNEKERLHIVINKQVAREFRKRFADKKGKLSSQIEFAMRMAIVEDKLCEEEMIF